MQIIKLCAVSKITFYYRINSYCDQILYDISQQKLISEEEESMKNRILKI